MLQTKIFYYHLYLLELLFEGNNLFFKNFIIHYDIFVQKSFTLILLINYGAILPPFSVVYTEENTNIPHCHYDKCLRIAAFIGLSEKDTSLLLVGTGKIGINREVALRPDD